MDRPFALVIEDDEDIAIMFAESLRAAGCNAEIILTGDEALTRLPAAAPDLVVLDLHLPGVEGTEILHQIEADARLAGIRVVVVTGDPVAAEGLEDLVDLVLIKPVSYDQLHDLVRRLVPTGALDK